jgi:hypothetical protein
MALQLQYNDRRRSFTIGLFLGVALMLAWQYWRTERANSVASLPPDEARFVKIVMLARQAWIDAPNDLARNGMRAARAAQLCQADPGMVAANWSGRIVSISPNGFPDYFGKKTAQIIIGLTSNLTLSTPSAPLINNPDMMVEAGSPIYVTASTLRPGQAVRFSAAFFGGTDCMQETSLTISGGMTNPQFKIRLTALANDPGPAPWWAWIARLRRSHNNG